MLKKCWKNMGPYKQHTLNRLKNLNILKLEDELDLAECKIIWKWEKHKLPQSLAPLIVEKHVNLRRRRFNIPRNSKDSSIEVRLAKKANSLMTTISNFKTKKILAKHIKTDIINRKYSFLCRRRSCFICSR
jgi:hypothetical protein